LLAESVTDFDPARAKAPWSRAVSQYADSEDKYALQRARMAAAMSAVGRAVYSALVETVRDVEDGIPTDRRHRDYLPDLLARYRTTAKGIDLSALVADLPALPRYLHDVLHSTQQWLDSPKDIMELRDVYAQAEETRKGRRARLSRRLSGKERRAEWNPEEQTLASAIQYRWSNVLRLLRDLKGGK